MIDANTMTTFPNLVVVNFDSEDITPKTENLGGNMNCLQFLQLSNVETTALKKAKRFTWLNISEKEWREICGGNALNCSAESTNRNIFDYLELQEELWRTANACKGRNKLKSNLTVNKQVQNRLREVNRPKYDKSVKYTKRSLPTTGEFDIALAQIRACEKLSLWFKFIDAFDLCIGWQKTFNALKASLQIVCFYMSFSMAAFIILIPLIFSENEFRKLKVLPENLLNFMSWINANLAFLPEPFAPPPEPKPWYHFNLFS